MTTTKTPILISADLLSRIHKEIYWGSGVFSIEGPLLFTAEYRDEFIINLYDFCADNGLFCSFSEEYQWFNFTINENVALPPRFLVENCKIENMFASHWRRERLILKPRLDTYGKIYYPAEIHMWECSACYPDKGSTSYLGLDKVAIAPSSDTKLKPLTLTRMRLRNGVFSFQLWLGQCDRCHTIHWDIIMDHDKEKP